MKTDVLVALCCALGSPAYAETLGEKTGVDSALGIAPTTADFVREAAISDMFELKSSALAKQKSDDATKKFAAQMIADHTKTTSELKPLAMKANVPVPSEMDSSHKDMLDKLAKLNGKDFTDKYHSDQVSAHKDAVSLFERYGKGGENAALKSFAAASLPTLQGHLKMAKDLAVPRLACRRQPSIGDRRR